MALTVKVEQVDSGIKVTFPNGTSCIVKEADAAEGEARDFLQKASPKLGLIDWQLPL
jgi:hypothetical protein